MSCRGGRALALDAERELGTNVIEDRAFSNLFLRHSSRPFVPSGCLPSDYPRALEVAERQGAISDYPPKCIEIWGVEESDQDFELGYRHWAYRSLDVVLRNWPDDAAAGTAGVGNVQNNRLGSVEPVGIRTDKNSFIAHAVSQLCQPDLPTWSFG